MIYIYRHLYIYLNGDEDNNGEGYISIYLELENTDKEVNAIFNFFIYDQLEDKYLCLQGTYTYISIFLLTELYYNLFFSFFFPQSV